MRNLHPATPGSGTIRQPRGALAIIAPVIPSTRPRLPWAQMIAASVILGLAGCTDQTPYFTPQASGTLNSTAQILGDLTFLFK